MTSQLLAPPRPVAALPVALPVAALRLEPAHGHVSSCFWDVARCRWSCDPDGAARTTGGAPRP
jgi:hypothetical protein